MSENTARGKLAGVLISAGFVFSYILYDELLQDVLVSWGVSKDSQLLFACLCAVLFGLPSFYLIDKFLLREKK
jgi:hypothetical protein